MADSDTTQQKSFHTREDVTAILEALKTVRAIDANIQAEAAAREAQKKAEAAAREANFTTTPDSDTTQHADIKKLLDSAAAIITTLEELDKAEWEEAIAEVKQLHREAREKLFARGKENPLITAVELMCISFLFGSFAAKAFF